MKLPLQFPGASGNNRNHIAKTQQPPVGTTEENMTPCLHGEIWILLSWVKLLLQAHQNHILFLIRIINHPNILLASQVSHQYTSGTQQARLDKRVMFFLPNFQGSYFNEKRKDPSGSWGRERTSVGRIGGLYVLLFWPRRKLQQLNQQPPSSH